MAGGLPPGGQLTTTTYVENFPGFVEPVLGIDLTDKFRCAPHPAAQGSPCRCVHACMRGLAIWA